MKHVAFILLAFLFSLQVSAEEEGKANYCNLPPVMVGNGDDPAGTLSHTMGSLSLKASPLEEVASGSGYSEQKPLRKGESAVKKGKQQVPESCFSIVVGGTEFYLRKEQLPPLNRGQERASRIEVYNPVNPMEILQLTEVEAVAGIKEQSRLSKYDNKPLDYLLTYGTTATKNALQHYFPINLISERDRHLVAEVDYRGYGVDEVCPICQDVLLSRQNITLCTHSSQHAYHTGCLATWLPAAAWLQTIEGSTDQKQTRCPACKELLSPTLTVLLSSEEGLVSELHRAAKAGEIAAISALLEAGGDVEAKDEQGNTALHLAAQAGHTDVILLLTDFGANFEAKNHAGQLPITTAAEHPDIIDIIKQANENPDIFFIVGAGREEALRQWRDEGENLEVTRPIDGASLLHIAAEHNRVDIARQLLDCAQFDLIDLANKSDNNKKTPLHIASSLGHLEFCELLIEHNANTCAIDYDNNTPITLAYQNDHFDVVKSLLDHLASIDIINEYLCHAASTGNKDAVRNFIRFGANPHKANNEGDMPLMLATKNGHIDVVNILLVEANVQVDCFNLKKQNPLMVALANNHMEIVDLLLRHGATLSLFSAVKSGNADFVKLSLRNNPDFNVCGHTGKTILMAAIENCSEEIIREIIRELLWREPDMTVNACEASGRTALMYAVQSGRKDIIRFLIRHGADVNQCDHNGQSALMYAHHGDMEVIRLLHNHGAISPLHWAVTSGNIDVVRRSLSNGANASQRDHNGKSVLLIAHEAGHTEIAKLLLQQMDSEAYHQELAYGCSERKPDFVRLLLENGASVSNSLLESVTHFARERHFRYNTMPTFELLLENSSSPDVKPSALLVTEADNVQLFHATRTGNIAKVRKLLKKNSALNTGNALYFAAHNGQFDVARHLLANGASPNFQRLTEGNTPLHASIQYHHTKLVELLLSNGADLWQANRHNVTPLDIALQSQQATMDPVLKKHLARKLFQAVQKPSEEVVQRVLDADASLVNVVREADGATALWVATQCGHLDSVKQLLEKQANPNQADSSRYTPLHLAAMKGSTEIAKLLLLAGAEPNPLSDDGYAPLHLAVLNGHTDVTRLLLGASGIEAGAFSANGETALHLAARGQQTDIIRLLLASGADFQVKDIQGDTALHTLCREYGPQALEQAIHQLEGHLNQSTLRTLNDRQETPLSLLMARPGISGAIRQRFMGLANRPLVRTEPTPRQATRYGQGTPKMTPFEYLHSKAKMPEEPLKKPVGAFTIQVAGSAFQISHHHLEPAKRGQECPGHVMAAMEDNPGFQLVLDQLEGVMDIPAARQLSKTHEAPLNYLITYGTDTTKQQLPGYYPTRAVGMRHNHLVVERKQAALTVDDLCVICQYPLLTRDVLVRPSCDCRQHFHGYCLATLLKTASTPQCPVCSKGLPKLTEMFCFSLLAEQELLSAARSGNRYIVKMMLEAGTSVDASDGEGNTALHMAAQGGHSEIALLLAKHGAAPDLTNNAGHTAKAVAKQAGHLDVADILTEASQTPSVFFTVGHGHKEDFIAYLDQGENIAITRPLDNSSLLHLAAENGQTEIVRILLDAAHRLNLVLDDLLDCHHRSALYLAAENGHSDIVAILLNRSAAMVNSADASGNTPLTAAALKGHVDAAFTLIEEGAIQTCPNKRGTTPLHAILKTFPEYALATFLEKQAHTLTPTLLTAVNSDNQSPLSLLNSRSDISAAIQQVFFSLAPAYAEEHFAEQARYSPQSSHSSSATSNECSICCDRAKNTVLMPCRHMLCQPCVEKLSICPFCNQKIESTLVVFPQ